MPNLDPSINKTNNKNEDTVTNTITDKFENHLLSIRDERQRMIYPNCHPTYNERYEKIIELIDWTSEKYRGRIKGTQQNEQVIIDNNIGELDKKRDIAINKRNKLN
jgi:hypothetical protein